MKFLLCILLICQTAFADTDIDGTVVASEDATVEYPSSNSAVEELPSDTTYTPTVDTSSSEDDSWGE